MLRAWDANQMPINKKQTGTFLAAESIPESKIILIPVIVNFFLEGI